MCIWFNELLIERSGQTLSKGLDVGHIQIQTTFYKINISIFFLCKSTYKIWTLKMLLNTLLVKDQYLSPTCTLLASAHEFSISGNVRWTSEICWSLVCRDK
jgi:hypothetical protein